MSRLITSVVIAGLLASICRGQDPGPSPGRRAEGQPTQRTVAEKRAWLRQQAVQGLSNPRQIRAVQAHVDLIRPQQIDKLVNAFLPQQLPPNPQQAQPQGQLGVAQAQALRQALDQEFLLWRNGNVGYAPVVTWLPEGTQLGASAVISPDRRYVTTNVAPFFSSVGPVYSYNLNTGETRLMPQYGTGAAQRSAWQSGNPYPWPPLGYGQSNMVPVDSPPKLQRWGYDNLHRRP